MENKDKIISFLREKGPSVPTAIAKSIEKDSLFASAYLSEMKEQGKVRISSLKLGGSPLYFLPGQESLLQRFSSNLGEKDLKMYELIKQKKVIRDSDLVPVFRISVRNLKDFAELINVSYQGQKEIFWKWFLLTKEEANQIIKSILKVPLEKTQPAPAPIQQTLAAKSTETKSENPSVKKTPEQNKHTESSFYQEVLDFFKANKISVKSANPVRPKTEAEFVVQIDSAVGPLEYFVKAKSKKRINEGDLSSAYVVGQTKRLPVIFLGKGDLSKKAKAMLETDFKGMSFKRI